MGQGRHRASKRGWKGQEGPKRRRTRPDWPGGNRPESLGEYPGRAALYSESMAEMLGRRLARFVESGDNEAIRTLKDSCGGFPTGQKAWERIREACRAAQGKPPIRAVRLPGMEERP